MNMRNIHINKAEIVSFFIEPLVWRIRISVSIWKVISCRLCECAWARKLRFSQKHRTDFLPTRRSELSWRAECRDRSFGIL